jgi:tetratricopeptide (TPR) repeat protein
MSERIFELEAQLATAAEANERIDLMNDLALELRFSDLERSITLSEQAVELAVQSEAQGLPCRPGRARGLHNLGIFYTQQGQYEKAINILSKALLMYEVTGDRKRIAEVLSSCGRVYIYLSDYPSALDYHMRALEISRDVEAKDVEATSLNNIGYLYITLSEWAKALTYLEQSLDLARKLNNVREQADALANSGNCYFQLGNFAHALDCGQESLQLYRSIGERQGEAQVLNNLGVIYQANGDLENALENFQTAIQISEEIGNRFEVVRVLRSVSDVQARSEQHEKALASLNQALAIAQEIQSRQEQYYCHQALASLYRQVGDFSSALAHYEQFHNIKESIFSVEADRRLRNLEVLYHSETTRREAETYQLKNIALQQEITERMQGLQALKSANEQLRYEIAERERLIADLNAFSYMVAHDLKNPLAAITGYASLMQMKLQNLDDLDSLRYLEIITQTSYRMNRIIDELLLLASVREQEIVPHLVDMGATVSEALIRLEHMTSQHQAQITQPDSWPPAMGYERWIEEVWVNYITNAIKYGGSPPQIQLNATLLPNNKVRYNVRPTGGHQPRKPGPPVHRPSPASTNLR